MSEFPALRNKSMVLVGIARDVGDGHDIVVIVVLGLSTDCAFRLFGPIVGADKVSLLNTY